MPMVPNSPSEDDRIAALHESGLLEAGPDPAFDAFVELASQICETPMALITLVDAERQVYKASVGFPDLPGETPRGIGFCDRTICGSDILEVPDARLDPRFADKPIVTGEPHAYFYAGAPLFDDDGFALGALCVFDTRPRALSERQHDGLKRLASSLSQLIAARRGVTAENLEKLTLLSGAIENIGEPIVLLTIGRTAGKPNTISYVNRAFAELFACNPADIIGNRMTSLIGPRTDMAAFDRLRSAVDTRASGTETIYLYTAAGEPRLVEVRDRVFSDSHRIISMIDLTEIQAAHDALAMANERLGSLLANNTEAVLTIDADGCCLDANAATSALFGFERNALLGDGIAAMTPEGIFPDRVPFPDALLEARTLEFSATYRHCDGRERNVECRAVPMMVNGRTEGAYVIARDVTESNRLAALVAEQAQRTHALYLISAAKGTTDAKQIDDALELVLDVFGMQYSFMARIEADTVYLLNVVGHGLVEVGDVFPIHATRLQEMRRIGDVYAVNDMSVPEGKVAGVPEYRDWHAYISVPLIMDGRIWGAIGFCSTNVVHFNDFDRDFVRLVAALVSTVLERQMQNKRLDDLAYLDTLTGLPNRAKFMRDFEATLSHAKRHDRAFAVHFIDLDGFKHVNDRAGHAVGDLALKEVARRLRTIPRLHDVPARLGGDEFVLLQTEIEQTSDTESLGNRIVAELSRPYELDRQIFRMGASIGVALFPQDGNDERTLLQSADIALYRAKALGKNRVEVSRKKAVETQELGLTS
jgi:diguanylate cyclase (GGDEF)-like protein/PAS domain S-box-containing protein